MSPNADAHMVDQFMLLAHRSVSTESSGLMCTYTDASIISYPALRHSHEIDQGAQLSASALRRERFCLFVHCL